MEGFKGLGLAGGLGVTAIGFFFLWLVMKQYFALADKNIGSANMITELMAKLTSMQESQLKSQTLFAEIYKHLDGEISKLQTLFEVQREFQAAANELYKHIDSELTRQTETLTFISGGLVKLIDESHFVNVAVEMGLLTREQGVAVINAGNKLSDP